jgi:M6 family metalloprotease-like protein
MKNKALFPTITLKSLTLLSVFAASANYAYTDQKIQSVDASQNEKFLKDATVELVQSSSKEKDEPNFGPLSAKTIKLQSRRDALLQAIRTNPQLFLKVAVPAKIRESLEEDQKEYVEKEVKNIEGILTTFEAFDLDGKGTLQHMLRTDDGVDYSLHLVNNKNDLPPSGSRVLLKHGITLHDPASTSDPIVAAYNGTDAPLQALVIATPPNTLGAQRTVFLLVNFSDKPTVKPWTPESVKSGVFTTVSNQFYEASYRQTSLTGDVFGWYTIANTSADCSDVYRIANQADQAAIAAGINPNSYAHKVYVFPSNSGCGWAGLAQVGSRTGTASLAWINGALTLGVVGHELGHNLGLHHSNAYSCGGTSPIGSSCTRLEYQDPTDMMGAITSGHFNVSQKERISWLNYAGTPSITTVQADGTYFIEPTETFSANSKGIKILKSNLADGSSDYYFLELRQSVGFDRVLNANFFTGVSIHQGNSLNRNTSYLLDMTPSTSSFYDSGLTPGKTFRDPNAPNGGVAITVNSVTTAGASVSVTFGGSTPSCVRANPTLTLSSSQTPWIPAGISHDYVVKLKNNDSLECPTSSYNLTSTGQTGVTAAFSSNTVSVNPNQSTSFTMRVTSAATTPSGIYSVNGIATHAADGAYKGTVTANIGIQTAECGKVMPSLSFEISNSRVAPGGTTVFRTNVKNNDALTCSPSTYNLATIVPANVTGTLNRQSVTLNPGSRVTVYLTAASALTTPLNTYALSLQATNASVPTTRVSGAVKFNVMSFNLTNWTFTLSALSPTYTVSPTATVNAALKPVVFSEGVPVSDAVSKLTITDPTGKVTYLTTKTAALGSGRFYFPLNGTSPKGVYQAKATVTLTGVTKSSSTTFSVN